MKRRTTLKRYGLTFDLTSGPDVAGYSRVIYHGMWSGIDLKPYSKDGSSLEVVGGRSIA